MSITIRSSYVKTALQPRDMQARAVSALAHVEFDTVVGTGLSGLLPLQHLADVFHVDFLAVRKPNDSIHSAGLAEGTLGDRWVFADDFISSGGTFNRVHEVVELIAAERGHQTQCVGSFCYDELPENRYRDMARMRYEINGVDAAFRYKNGLPH